MIFTMNNARNGERLKVKTDEKSCTNVHSSNVIASSELKAGACIVRRKRISRPEKKMYMEIPDKSIMRFTKNTEDGICSFESGSLIDGIIGISWENDGRAVIVFEREREQDHKTRFSTRLHASRKTMLTLDSNDRKTINDMYAEISEMQRQIEMLYYMRSIFTFQPINVNRNMSYQTRIPITYDLMTICPFFETSDGTMLEDSELRFTVPYDSISMSILMINDVPHLMTNDDKILCENVMRIWCHSINRNISREYFPNESNRIECMNDRNAFISPVLNKDTNESVKEKANELGIYSMIEAYMSGLPIDDILF